MFTIYTVRNTINDKIYIGKTSRSPHERWREHLSHARTANTYLARAIRKYGKEAFALVPIDRVRTEKEANRREVFYIAAFSSYKPSKGYNLTMGGDGTVPNEATRLKMKVSRPNFKHTDATRLLLSEIQRGKKRGKYSAERRQNISNALKGKKLSPEHRAKAILNLNHKGIPHSEEHKRKIAEANVKTWERKRLENPQVFDRIAAIGRASKGQKRGSLHSV